MTSVGLVETSLGCEDGSYEGDNVGNLLGFAEGFTLSN